MAVNGSGTQADRAYSILLHRLLFLDYAPGELLDEGEMCEELGIGRTPVREALKRLEGEGLVEFYRRRGIFATHVDITALSALYEYRAYLEPIAARMAAEKLNPRTAAVFKELRERLGHADEMTKRELLVLDADVHAAIFRACGNQYLEHDLFRIDNLATRIWCMVLERASQVEAHVTEHIAIIDALLAQDADKAAELVLEHVNEFEASVRQLL